MKSSCALKCPIEDKADEKQNKMKSKMKTKLSRSRVPSSCSAVLVVDSMDRDEALEVVQGGLVRQNIPRKAR